MTRTSMKPLSRRTGQGHAGSALLQGPYVSVKLPFAPAPADVEIPLEVKPPYLPHLHQLRAWQRLSSRGGHQPEATRHQGHRALSDECARIGSGAPHAEIIHGDPRMMGRLRVGLYVGGEGRHRDMGKDHVIDHHDVLKRQPPDILLTNYRMLDYLLVRPKDHCVAIYLELPASSRMVEPAAVPTRPLWSGCISSLGHPPRIVLV